MTSTKVFAGRLVAIYVEDGQGRRLVVGDPNGHGLISAPIVFAMTRSEAKAACAAIMALADELPP